MIVARAAAGFVEEAEEVESPGAVEVEADEQAASPDGTAAEPAAVAENEAVPEEAEQA